MEKINSFKMWCQKVLPLVYDDSLSYYETLCKVVTYLNNVIGAINEDMENIGELTIAVNELNDFVRDYFDNLNVQTEIDNKLDRMATDGTLTNLVKTYVDPIYQAYENRIDNEIDEMKLQLTTPFNFKGTVATSSALPSTAEINDTYYVEDLKYRVTWNGSAWSQSSLSEGDYEDELSQLNENYSELKGDLAQFKGNVYEKNIPIKGVFEKASDTRLKTYEYLDKRIIYVSIPSDKYNIQVLVYDGNINIGKLKNINGQEYSITTDGWTEYKELDVLKLRALYPSYSFVVNFFTIGSYVANLDDIYTLYRYDSKGNDEILASEIVNANKIVFNNVKYSLDGTLEKYKEIDGNSILNENPMIYSRDVAVQNSKGDWIGKNIPVYEDFKSLGKKGISMFQSSPNPSLKINTQTMIDGEFGLGFRFRANEEITSNEIWLAHGYINDSNYFRIWYRKDTKRIGFQLYMGSNILAFYSPFDRTIEIKPSDLMGVYLHYIPSYGVHLTVSKNGFVSNTTYYKYDLPTLSNIQHIAIGSRLRGANSDLISNCTFADVELDTINPNYLDYFGIKRHKQGHICFVFDDGFVSDLTAMQEQINRGINPKGTSFIIGGAIGGDGRLTVEQCKTLLNNGWDLQDHSWSHMNPHIHEMTGNELRADLKRMDDFFTNSLGVSKPKHYSIPGGTMTKLMQNVIGRERRTMMVGGSKILTSSSNRLMFNAFDISPSYSMVFNPIFQD